MALNLDTLVIAKPVEMPKSPRGRTAEPVPASLIKAISDSFKLPEGSGLPIRVTNGAEVKNDDGKAIGYGFENVNELTNLLRRGAKDQKLGLTIKFVPLKKGKQNAASLTDVIFRAVPFTPRPRSVTPAVAESMTGRVSSDDEGGTE